MGAILRTSICSIQAADISELSEEDTFSLYLSTGVYICFELDYQTYQRYVVLQLGSLEHLGLSPALLRRLMDLMKL